MTNLHTRLLTLSEIFGLAVETVRAQFKKMFIIFSGSLLLNQLATIYSSGSNILSYKQLDAASSWIAFLFYIIVLLCSLVAFTALAFIVKGQLTRQEVSLTESLKKAFSKLGPLLGLSAIVGAAIVLLVVLLVLLTLLFAVLFASGGDSSGVLLVLGILSVPFLLVAVFAAMTYLIFANYAIVLDDAPVFSSFGKSYALVKGYFWSTLGFLVLFGLINMAVGVLIVLINLLLTPLLMLSTAAANLISLVITVPVMAVVNILVAACLTILYLNRKAVLHKPESRAQLSAAGEHSAPTM